MTHKKRLIPHKRIFLATLPRMAHNNVVMTHIIQKIPHKNTKNTSKIKVSNYEFFIIRKIY